MNIAFIFARGGSKGLKNKNIKIFNGKPLIYYSIEIAKKINLIDDIYVSTDDSKISKISLTYGAKIIKRPKNLSKDSSDEWKAWQHAVNYIKKKNIKFDKFISLPCTSPLRSKEDVVKCINRKNNKNDMVITYCKTNHNPYFNMVMHKKNNQLKKIMNLKKNIIRRQDAPKIFDMCTVAYVTSPSFIVNNNNLFDGRTEGVEIHKNRSIDIDDILDFKFAEYIYSKILNEK
tara:strand:- start:162 stop:854 length:693 start_codon:yes stop_codon:yes gene_type:complete